MVTAGLAFALLFFSQSCFHARERNEAASLVCASHKSVSAATKGRRQTADCGQTDGGRTDERTDLSLKPNNHLS